MVRIGSTRGGMSFHLVGLLLQWVGSLFQWVESLFPYVWLIEKN